MSIDRDALAALQVLETLGRDSRGGSSESRRDGNLQDPEERAAQALAQMALAPGRRAPRGTEDITDERLTAMKGGRNTAKAKAVAAKAVTAAKVTGAAVDAKAEKVCEQAPGWQQERGVDTRTQLDRAVLRHGFAAATGQRGAFAEAQGAHINLATVKADVMVVAEAIERAQKEI